MPVLAFIFFNAYPARLFLGDSGAQLLGFIFGSIAIIFDPNTGSQSSTWLFSFIFYVPLFDLVLVIVSRLRRRKNVYVASRDQTFSSARAN